jgi:hypothetical protein
MRSAEPEQLPELGRARKGIICVVTFSMQPDLLALKVRYGRNSAREWLLHWLGTHGPTPKHAVVAAYLAYCHAHPPKQARKRLEEAFQRAKVRGLVTGDKAGWQGPSIWRLCAPGELPRLWLRRPGRVWRPGRLRMVAGRGGLWHFDYGMPRGSSRPDDRR